LWAALLMIFLTIDHYIISCIKYKKKKTSIDGFNMPTPIEFVLINLKKFFFIIINLQVY